MEITSLCCLLQAARTTSENLDKAGLAARDIANSKSAHEASSKVWTLWQRIEKGTFVTSLARMLVNTNFSPRHALYYLGSIWGR